MYGPRNESRAQLIRIRTVPMPMLTGHREQKDRSGYQ